MVAFIGLTKDGRIKFRLSSEKKEVTFDFNGNYKGYYPECRFTAVGTDRRHMYAAGTDDAGVPHLFVSEFGMVWSPINISSGFTYSCLDEYGDVIQILYDEIGKYPVLITKNGYLVTIPDCSKCVGVRKVSDIPIEKAEFSGDEILFTDSSGKTKNIYIHASERFKCEWSFAVQHIKEGGILIDLREPSSAYVNPLPDARLIPFADLFILLNSISKDRYLFFSCERGFRSEQAVLEARTRGFDHAYTLGCAVDVLHDLDS